MLYLRSFNRFILISLALLGLSLSSPTALASPITIVNSSFEDTGGVVLISGGFTTNGTGLTGWTIGPLTGPVGLFKPSGHFSSIPDGDHVAYSHGPDISQLLTETLTVNTRYTLTVDVGDANNTPFPGYSIRLLAGGNTLVEDSNSLTPNGGFLTSTLVFDALLGDLGLGQQLEIVLDSLGQETSFDFVTLDASAISAVPVPAAVWLFGTALIGFVGLSRKTKVS